MIAWKAFAPKNKKGRAEGRYSAPSLSIFLIPIFLILTYSCATPGNVSGSRYTRLIENVPFYPQETHQCGPASLAGALNYWGVKVIPEDIAEEIYSKAAKGTLNLDMVIYPQKKGLIAIQYRGSTEDLRKNIDSDNPIIVMVDYGYHLYQVNHFMVVVGYNELGVIVNSGKKKGEFLGEKDFLKAWEKTNFWTLLIKR
ncbi:MAG: C39 family peptidase [Nitrospirota bacterium]